MPMLIKIVQERSQQSLSVVCKVLEIVCMYHLTSLKCLNSNFLSFRVSECRVYQESQVH